MTRKVHYATRRAADKDLAEGIITEQSHAAVLAGEMDIATARNIGADDDPTGTPVDRSGPRTVTEGARSASAEGHQDAPPQPVSRLSKNDTRQFCWCGCEQLTSPGRIWRPGHDQRAKGIIKRAVRDGTVAELPPRLKEYGAERGLL